MEIMTKYDMVSFFDEKGFKLSNTFAQVLSSCMAQHSQILMAILYAVKSFASEASDFEKTAICTHMAMHMISGEEKAAMVEYMLPMLRRIKPGPPRGIDVFESLLNEIRQNNKFK